MKNRSLAGMCFLIALVFALRGIFCIADVNQGALWATASGVWYIAGVLLEKTIF